jgi:hypothetical protein
MIGFREKYSQDGKVFKEMYLFVGIYQEGGKQECSSQPKLLTYYRPEYTRIGTNNNITMKI